ncbi:MAG TPA: hypothetical protein VNV36_13340, partial [Pseudomonas sp.]|nr:hypothetical protein [Pseudomonas sp.]
NTGDVLDPVKLPENSDIQISKWNFQESGKPLFLILDGIDREGNAIKTTIRNGEPHNSTEGFTVPAPIDWLAKLNNNSKLEITSGVNPDGIADINKAVIFPKRTYTITAPPELIFDTSPLTLDGRNISIVNTELPWERTGVDPANTAAKRTATGGCEPYTYTSSDSNIASIDDSGTVRSEGNGCAIITVTDSAGQSKSYEVTTRNVINYICELVHARDLQTWVNSVGGRLIPLNELSTVHTPILNMKYRYPGTSGATWVTRPSENPSAYYGEFLRYMPTELFKAVTGWGGSPALVICMRIPPRT